MNAQRARALETAIASMEGMFGSSVIRRAGELPPPAVMPTGLPELDAALGIGGIPKGRIVEIYGPESAGKTALALQIAKQAQAALFIDAEHALSPALLNGCEGLHILSLESLQDVLQAVLAAAPAFDVIVLDTLTALPTQEDLRRDIGEYSRKNPTAKVLSSVLPRISAALAKNGYTLLVVNQMREAPGVLFGNPERIPGGHALKHYASMRLDLRRIEPLRESQDVTGQRIRVKVVKNKCAAPFKEATLDLIYGSGYQVTSGRPKGWLA